jgi:hypothetical protein
MLVAIYGEIVMEGDFTLTDGTFNMQGQGPFTVHGLTNIASGAFLGDGSDTVMTYNSLIINSGGTFNSASGSNTYITSLRNLGGTVT